MFKVMCVIKECGFFRDRFHVVFISGGDENRVGSGCDVSACRKGYSEWYPGRHGPGGSSPKRARGTLLGGKNHNGLWTSFGAPILWLRRQS